LIDFCIDSFSFLIIFDEFILDLLNYLTANNWNEQTLRVFLNYAEKELEKCARNSLVINRGFGNKSYMEFLRMRG
jgi:hypothetical protein